MNKLEQIVIQTLSEAAKVNFAGHQFLLKVDTNEDPQKKGIKVQFIPTEFGKITPTERNDIANELAVRLNDGLAEFDLRVERDRQLKDKTIVGYFIYADQIDKMIRRALAGTNPDQDENEPEV